MVAVALAFGVTALLVPLRFEEAPRPVLGVPPFAVLLFGALALDGRLARLDGALLLAGYVAAVGFLVRQERRGANVTPTEAVSGMLKEELQGLNRWKALGLLSLALVAIVVGSELLVAASKTIIGRIGLSGTTFGMTILALVVSIEEVARELPAALKGRPDISFGNVVGSVLAFFLFNAGLIALVQPVTVGAQTLRFYLPMSLAAIVLVSIFMMRKHIPRWVGAVLLLVYIAFAAGGYVLF